ncbi:SH3 domain-containing protein [Domibacillus indicus]|uniref:SH3 domain-containing protein n=1 Tax=Domibacillus indicus TaxID=1437523 RepID=UPI00203A4C1F|nr:SH3 domain-containing protein [Domibacillus indicus]MCM3788874.1 SH3 domain-containing protein [Domibacillus indicus]
MKKNKFVYFTLAFILALSVALGLQPAKSNAASAKVGYVSIDSGVLNVRSGPGTNYKVIGSLKNNVSVSVYSQSKSGWSQIAFKGKRGYVSSKYLRMYSYLMDKTKVYTYKSGGETTKSVYKGKYSGWDQWSDSAAGGTYLVYENNKGLYIGWPESEYYMEIAYPIKTGKTWTDAFDESIVYKITGTGGTLTTAAGKFTGVVTIKSNDGYVSYYAANVGFIKGTYNGKTTSELIKLTKK